MKHTRNEFKKFIKDSSYDELQKELNKVNRLLFMARDLIQSQKQNPYSKDNGKIDVKMLKYKKGLIINKLNKGETK